MMLLCCCSKSRDELGNSGATPGLEHIGFPTETLSGYESRSKNINRILIEYISEEVKLGMRNVHCLDMVEKVLLASNNEELSKKDVVHIYRSIEAVNHQAVKHFLVQDFFFTDNTRQKYDFTKIVVFNLLYSGGKDSEKANFLFNLIESTTAKTSAVHIHSPKMLKTLEYLTFIPTIAVGEILNAERRFDSESEEQDFLELLALYGTNAYMLNEFA
jgi:hypothetical protein